MRAYHQVSGTAQWTGTGWQLPIEITLPEDVADADLLKWTVSHSGSGAATGTLYVTTEDPGTPSTAPAKAVEVVQETITTLAATAVGIGYSYVLGAKPFIAPANRKLYVYASLATNSGAHTYTFNFWFRDASGGVA